MSKRLHDVLDVVGVKQISDSALAHVMRLVSERHLDPMSAKQVSTISKNEFAKVSRSIELRLIGGGTFVWEIASLGELLNYFVESSEEFGAVMWQALFQRHHLQLVLYLDELTPGNVLKPDNRRKLWAIYGSFHELGREQLYKEYVWLPLACLRSDTAKKVKGGVSGCMRALCNDLFGEGLQNVSQAGVILKLPNKSKLFTVSLRSVIADAPAIKAFFNFKGPTGVKPCPRCLNVLKRGFPCSADSGLVDVTCSDVSKITAATDDDIWRAFDSMGGVDVKAQLDRLEKATGINYCPDSLLADIDLRRHVRPCSTVRFDWVHILMVGGGVLSHEMHTFLTSCKSTLGIGYAQIHEFVVASWCFPDGESKKRVRYIFTDAREKSSNAAEGFKAMASEHLLVYPLMRHFACTIVEPTGRLDAVVHTFVAICNVVDAIVACKHGHGRPDKVRRRVAEYHSLAKESRGVDDWRWKDHAMLHIADQIETDGVVLDTFAHERKHQILKHAVQHVDNLRCLERSSLSRTILEQRRQLRTLLKPSGLLGTAVADSSLSAALNLEVSVANGLFYRGSTYRSDSVVIVRGVPAKILVCFQGQSQAGLVLSPYLVHRRVHAAALECVPTGRKEVHFFTGSDISEAHAWYTTSDGKLCVLHGS